MAQTGQQHLFSPRGSTRVSGDRIIHARGDQQIVLWYDFEGSLIRVSRWASPRVQATDSLWDHMSARLREIRPFSQMPEEVYRAEVAKWRAAATGPCPCFRNSVGIRPVARG